MKIAKHEIPHFGKAYALLNLSFIILDQEFRIEYFNETLRDILKLDIKHKILNRPFFQFWADLKLAPFLDANGQVIHQNPIKIQGSFLQWECLPAIVDEENKWFLISKDVTEKEQMYRSLEEASENILGFKFSERCDATYYINEVYNYLNGIINKIPCFVYWKNRELQYIGCNQMAANFINFERTEQIIGKSDFDIFSDRDLAQEYRDTDEQVFTTGKAVINQPGELINNEGMLIHTLVSKIPIFNQAGEVIGLAGISVDVTDLKNAQTAAELAHQVKTEFIANMSHDIRTPLTGVVGMSKMLEDSARDANQKQYAYWLGESGKQLLNMLNGILDVISSDNLNEADLHEKPFNLRQLIHDIEQLERPSTLIKNINLRAFIDKAIPACFISDATKIHRVLLNLLGNAIKFTQAGHVEIHVTLLEQNETHAHIQFRIVDTGMGIPTELHHKVFDRFYRGTPSDKGAYTGHGVGLHIAQSYVNLLGGNITLSSEPGAGTTFYFDLLLKIDNNLIKITTCRPNDGLGDKLTHLPLSATSLATTSCGPVPKLLLVEDNKIALFTLENLISQAGCQFTSAMDGETALHLVQTQAFDLIITDLGLPGLSGIDLTLKARAFEQEQQKKPTPIVGLTAHSEESIKTNCLKAGMNEVFTKPITAEVLAEIKKIYFATPYNPQAATAKSPEAPVSGPLGLDLPDSEPGLFNLDAYTLFDAQAALVGMGGDLHLLKSILKSIIERETPADVLEMEKAHAVGDWVLIEKLAHRMKSGFVYCGALKLVHACQYMECYSKAGYSQLLEPLYQQLLAVTDETKNAVNAWLLVN